MDTGRPLAAPLEGVNPGARLAAIARLGDLFSDGSLSLERFSGRLDQAFAASTRAELEAAMSALPPPVRLTPPSQSLPRPLVLRAGDGDLRLGSGWQLAADTTISTGCGATRLDLVAASWDSLRVDLRLQTWGSIEVLVPEGVAVQMVGGSARVALESLAPPVPGGPRLRICALGPAGSIRIHHPTEPRRPLRRWRRRHARPSSGDSR